MSGTQPSGTVTFLFTDIEGSTRLWEERPVEMREALAAHDEILRGAITDNGGHVFATGGDGFGAAFSSAGRAVGAGVAAQRALAATAWPEGCELGVRMGLHTGETDERAGDYFGPTVNRAARIMGLANAGQILVSGVSRQVTTGPIGNDVGFDRVGTTRLRGVDADVEIFRVVASGLRDVDPPALDPGELEGNLRASLSSFIGRDQEVTEVIRAAGQHRLVTLIGVGGVGKTRLATESALESGPWSDGAWLVELASIQDEDEVGEAVARTLGIQQIPGLTHGESVLAWAQRRRLLLVLDNCEHVLRSAASLAHELVGGTDAVTVLATSREPLRLPGEFVISVPSLALPDEDGSGDGAAELFIARAKAEVPNFDPEGHRQAIGEVCRQLDGVPLALELAAPLLRGLSVEAIASRLEQRFRLLTGGHSTAAERHATLRATVDWSYEMLSDDEIAVFGCLSVFAGPFTLDDAIAVADSDMDELDVINALAQLVDRSLVVRVDTSPEYRLLQTLRAYGRERLDEAGKSDKVANRHAALMASKAERIRVAAQGPGEGDAVKELRAQMVDYRAAVRWASDHGDADFAVQIAENVFIVASWWGESSHPGQWVHELVDAQGQSDRTAATSRWLTSAWYMFFVGDLERALELASEAVELDSNSAMAHVLDAFGAMLSGRVPAGLEAASAAREYARDPAEELRAFIVLGNILLMAGEVSQASEVADDFVAWSEDKQYPSAMAMAHHLKGRVLSEQEPAEALRTFEQGLQIIQAQIPSCWIVSINLHREMIPLINRTNPSDAAMTALAALEPCLRHNETGHVISTFAHTAVLLTNAAYDHAAAQLMGAAGYTGSLTPSQVAGLEQAKATIRGRLGDAAFDELLEQGSLMSTADIARTVIDALKSLQTG